ncbi:MAG: hypothetical protein Q4D74_07750, partial [Comamonadaceae bacterium]|nr:hypothetical protein [Comamonadaceae bacterium]
MVEAVSLLENPGVERVPGYGAHAPPFLGRQHTYQHVSRRKTVSFKKRSLNLAALFTAAALAACGGDGDDPMRAPTPAPAPAP